ELAGGHVEETQLAVAVHGQGGAVRRPGDRRSPGAAGKAGEAEQCQQGAGQTKQRQQASHGGSPREFTRHRAEACLRGSPAEGGGSYRGRGRVEEWKSGGAEEWKNERSGSDPPFFRSSTLLLYCPPPAPASFWTAGRWAAMASQARERLQFQVRQSS